MLVVIYVLCMLMTLTRSKVKVKVTGLLKFRQLPKIAYCFSRSISSAILAWSIGAQNSWLVMIVRDLDYSLSEADFGVSFYESYRVSSNVAECR